MANNGPTLFIIAGSNGAGKSTNSVFLLPEYMQGTPIWDFDMQFYEYKKLAIAGGIKPKEAIIKAEEQVSDLFNERRRVCMQQQKSFAYERHFTSGAQWQPLLQAKQQGFFVHLVYLGLSSVTKSIARVMERVQSGGHYVNEQNIKINYYSNLDMLDRNHQVDIYETDKFLNKVCTIKNGLITEVINFIPDWIKNEMPELTAAIEAYYSKEES